MRKTGYMCLLFLMAAVVSAHGVADYSIILKRNLFSQPPPPKPEVIQTPILKPSPAPALNSLIDLTGIIYFTEGDSFVILNMKKTNEEVFYRVGDVVENAEITKIEQNCIVFMYDGKEERMYLKQDTEGVELIDVAPGVTARLNDVQTGEEAKKIVNPAAVEMPKFEEPVSVEFSKTIDELRNDKELMKKLNVAPDVKNGRMEGFRISNLPPDSLPYVYGLRDGDVLKTVNGVFIDSIAKGFAVYNQIIKDRTEVVTVEVLRNNSPVVFTFRLR